jgi:hypothetical protein
MNWFSTGARLIRLLVLEMAVVEPEGVKSSP